MSEAFYHIVYLSDHLSSNDPSKSLTIDLSKLSEEARKSKYPILFILLESSYDGNKDSLAIKKEYFLTSSIWFRTLYLKPKNVMTIDDWKKKLNQEKERLIEHYNKNIERFTMANAIENKEYALRMFEQSHLVDLGGHYAKIEPNFFHSEAIFKRKIGNNFKNPSDPGGKYYREIYNFLSSKGKDNKFSHKYIKIALCDDYALVKLKNKDDSKYDNTALGSNEFTKSELIEDVFQNRLKTGEYLNDIIKIIPLESVDELTSSKHKFDIILLDYLFSIGKNNGAYEVKQNADYGTKFLIEFNRKKENKNSRDKFTLTFGFQNTHWILPISAFSDSMINELQNQGITFTSDDIYLSKGADPITEPYLFLYELLYMINEQIKVAVGWCIDWDIETKPKIQEVCYAGFALSQDDLESKRKDWINKFSEVSAIFSKITQIELDAEDVVVDGGEKISGSHSFLAESLQTYLKDPTNRSKIRILTHYRDLLYQLAFKSYQDNEYIFIEANKLKEALNK